MGVGVGWAVGVGLGSAVGPAVWVAVALNEAVGSGFCGVHPPSSPPAISPMAMTMIFSFNTGVYEFLYAKMDNFKPEVVSRSAQNGEHQ